jgi:hypothetical protein
MRVFFLLASLFVAHDAMKAEWTQYADSAALPMSKQYRDQLRERLSKIDMSSLSGEEKANIQKLKSALDQDTSRDEHGFQLALTYSHYLVIGSVLLTLALLLVYKFRGPSLVIPDPDHIRAARLAKYE